MGNKASKRRPPIDEQYTRPQGLYPHRDLDHRKLRRLIMDAKLAPCHPGNEEPGSELEECPICFLNYPSLNRSKCCGKGICTECFLQMKSPEAARPMQCPFCKAPTYAVEFRGAKTEEERGLEWAEEQKVIEAKIRMQQEEILVEQERVRRRAAGEPDVTSSLVSELQQSVQDLESAGSPAAQSAEPRPGEPTRPPPEPPSWGLWNPATRGSGGGGGARGIDPDSLWLRSTRSFSGGIQPNQLLASGASSGYTTFFSPNAAQGTDHGPGAVSSHSAGSSSGGDDVDVRSLRGRGGAQRQGVGDAYASLMEAIARDEYGSGRRESRSLFAVPPSRSPPSFHRSPPSDEEEEMDMDNVMLMEAIWRSLQDEDARRLVQSNPPAEANSAASGSSQSEARLQPGRPSGEGQPLAEAGSSHDFGEAQNSTRRNHDAGESCWGEAPADLNRPARSGAKGREAGRGASSAASGSASWEVGTTGVTAGEAHGGEAEVSSAMDRSSWRSPQKGAFGRGSERGFALGRVEPEPLPFSWREESGTSTSEASGARADIERHSSDTESRLVGGSGAERGMSHTDPGLGDGVSFSSQSRLPTHGSHPMGRWETDLAGARATLPRHFVSGEGHGDESASSHRLESFLLAGGDEELAVDSQRQDRENFLNEMRNVPGSFEEQMALALAMSMAAAPEEPTGNHSREAGNNGR